MAWPGSCCRSSARTGCRPCSNSSRSPRKARTWRWACARGPAERSLVLHYDNVLAGEREPWLAVDPEPLAGNPGFDLLPAQDNRWDELLAPGDPARAVRRRFDRLTEALALDRDRAAGWTLARVPQNALWDMEDGKPALDPVRLTIAETLARPRT